LQGKYCSLFKQLCILEWLNHVLNCVELTRNDGF
jgi:hypothetical protein